MGGMKEVGWGQGAVGRRRRNYFPVVGDVYPYGGAYQGGTGGQTGDGEKGKILHVLHPEWTERGSVIGTSRAGAETG